MDECTFPNGSTKSNSIKALFEWTGLHEVFQNHFNERKKSTTTTDGRFIDHVATRQIPLQCITMLGTHMPAISDHVGITIDIDSASLLSSKYSLMANYWFQKLMVQNLKSREKYESTVLKQVQETKMVSQAIALPEKAAQGITTEEDKKKLFWLNAQLTEIVLGAEKSFSKRKLNCDPWSPLLKQAGERIIYWKHRLAQVHNPSNTDMAILKALTKASGITCEVWQVTESICKQ